MLFQQARDRVTANTGRMVEADQEGRQAGRVDKCVVCSENNKGATQSQWLAV